MRLHLGENSYLYRISLTELEDQLPADRFVRVHRSALVNLERIERIEPTVGGLRDPPAERTQREDEPDLPGPAAGLTRSPLPA